MRVLLAVAVLWLLMVAGQAQLTTTFVGPGASGQGATVLQIATRSRVPWGYNSGLGAGMFETWHKSRDAITSLRIVIPNWYVDTNNNTNTYQELGTGTTASVKAGIWSAAGAFLGQVLFSGSATGSIASGATLTSDAFAVAIPNNTFFRVRILFTNAGGTIYSPLYADATLGDRFEFTGVDKTASGTVANGLAGYAFFPAAILGLTGKRSACLFGTSRTNGSNDVADGVTGDIGMVARGIGPLAGYVNAGVPGDSAQRLAANPTKRAAIGNLACSDIYVEHGVNDAGRTLLQKQTDLGTFYALFPTKNVHGITVSPQTTGAWTLADGSDQTNAQGTQLTDLNTWLLTKPAPLYATHDVASDHSLVGTPTKWKAPGFTDDGLHGLPAAYTATQANGTLTIN